MDQMLLFSLRTLNTVEELLSHYTWCYYKESVLRLKIIHNLQHDIQIMTILS